MHLVTVRTYSGQLLGEIRYNLREDGVGDISQSTAWSAPSCYEDGEYELSVTCVVSIRMKEQEDPRSQMLAE